MILDNIHGPLRSCAMKSPGFGDRRNSMLQDIAVLTGGEVVSEELGLKLDTVTLAPLGRVRCVVVDRDTTTIMGGDHA